MMNTRHLTGKSLIIVKKGLNAAKCNPHSKSPVEATNVSECIRSAKRLFNQTQEPVRGAIFISKHMYTKKNSWEANVARSRNANALPSEFSCGIGTSSLAPRGENSLMVQQRRTMSTRAVNAKRGTVEGIITTLNDKFNADIVNDTQAVYQFNILSGDNREIYYIDLRNGSGSAGKGKSEACPDTIFSIDTENFNRLIEGNLRAPTAYMTGRMKISGSMQKAAKLEKLFATLLEKGTF